MWHSSIMTKKEIQIERMLLWFKSTLPKHALANFAFHVQPSRRLVLNEKENVGYMESWHKGILVGDGSCSRCGCCFDLEKNGIWIHLVNGTAEEVEAAIVEAKAKLQEYAERDSECWGDVPQLPNNQYTTVSE